MTMELCIKCRKCRKRYPETIEVNDSEVNDLMDELLVMVEKDNWKVDWAFGDVICPDCVKKNEKLLSESIEYTTYLHSSKDDNRVMIDEIEGKFGINLPQEAIDQLIYCLYEVNVKLSIDPRTGDYKILSFKE